MNKKDLFRLIILYILLFLLGSTLLVISFHIQAFTKIIDVLFYRGILLIVFWGLIISLIMLCLKAKVNNWHDVITIRDVLLLFVAFCCIQVVFFTHLPVTAERSISVFMLGYMSDNQNETFTKEEIKDYFINKYVNEYGAFDKRFHEQIVTGTIEETDGGFRITKRGKALMKLYGIIANSFNIDKKIIHSSL